MGGHAFESHNPPLSTPRLSPETYASLCKSYTLVLRTLYALVAVPLPAPGKLSHGDIDILLSSPAATHPVRRAPATEPPFSSHLPHILSALDPPPRAHLHTPSSAHSTSIAMPHPHIADAYVQLDLTLVPNEPEGLFAWTLFGASHGDLVNMLAPALRAVGLIVTGQGLCVLSEEIARVERKRARCFLSRAPIEVLDWLGLDGERGEWGLWGGDGVAREEEEDGAAAKQGGFRSEEELFAAVSSMRFFNPEAYKRLDLKANDRRRMGKRDQYRRFCEEWVPRIGREWREEDMQKRGGTDFKRESVLQESLERFGMAAEWEEKHRAWRAEREELRVRKELRERRKEEQRHNANKLEMLE